MTTKVLIIEDDAALRHSIVQCLELEDLDPIPTSSFTQARRSIRSNFNGVILSDIKMPDHTGFDVLKFAQSLDEDLPVVLLTGHSDVPTAMKAIRDGAYDYLEKPCETGVLVDTLRRALDHRALVLRNRSIERKMARSDAVALLFPGQSEATQKLRDDLRAVADSADNIHFYGEENVGKGTAAYAVHKTASEDRDLVTLNCASATLTDLDSIEWNARISLSLKNLHKADERFLAHLNALKLRSRDLRIMTTSTLRFPHGLEHVSIGPTREVFVPSLAQRKDDIVEVFSAILRQSARIQGLDMPTIPDSVVNKLNASDLSENLTELRRLATETLSITRETEPVTLAEKIDKYEQTVISEALSAADGKVTIAAEALGVPRNTLYDRMARFGLVAKDFRKT